MLKRLKWRLLKLTKRHINLPSSILSISEHLGYIPEKANPRRYERDLRKALARDVQKSSKGIEIRPNGSFIVTGADPDQYVHLHECYICGRRILISSGTACCPSCDGDFTKQQMLDILEKVGYKNAIK